MKSQIRNLYPILQNEDFRIYIINQQRRFEEVPFSSLFLKEKKYTGTVIIKICEKQEITSIDVWTIPKALNAKKKFNSRTMLYLWLL